MKGEMNTTCLTESDTGQNHQMTVAGKTSDVSEVSRERVDRSGVTVTRKCLTHLRSLATGGIAQLTVTAPLGNPTALVTTVTAEVVAHVRTNLGAVTTEMTDHDKAPKHLKRSSASANVPRSWLPCKRQQRISIRTASGA